MPRYVKPVPVGTTFNVSIGQPYKKNGTVYLTPCVKTGANLVNQTNPRRNGHYVAGGPWYMWKKVTTYNQSASVQAWQSGRDKGPAYVGSYWCVPQLSVAPPVNWNSLNTANSEMTAMQNRGAEAWNLVRPDLPDFSIGNSLYELRETPQMLRQTLGAFIRDMKNSPQWLRKTQRQLKANAKRSGMSHAGEWFLAVEFGWIPLLKDIRLFVSAQRDKQKRLRQLIRDAGRPVKRYRRMPPLASEEEKSSYQKSTDWRPYNGAMRPTLNTGTYTGGGSSIALKSTYKVKWWVEGSFRYYLPPGPHDVVWTRKMYRRIMGWRVTPTMVWNAMPWTWLSDYFIGLGQFMQSVSAGVADNLVCDYCYLMKRKNWLHETACTQTIRTSANGSQGKSVTAVTSEEWVTKTRIAANPFGFGIKQTSLNVKQIAIMGALGLSRLP